MGATPSVQRDAKSPEDAPEDAVIAEVNDTRDGENVDDKTLQKNGQISISSLNGKTEDQSEYNGHTEDNPPAEVGQTENISQKEDSADTIEVHQEEAAPQVNGEKGDDSANADEITTTEEKTVEEKQEEANEVGFKKIFRFVGFKFTLKKDKSEKTEPVQLLTVKEAEDGAQDASSEENKEEPTTEEATTEEAISVVEKSPAATEKEQEKTDEDVTDKVEETTEEPEADVPEAEKSGDEVPEKSAEEEEAKSDKDPEPELQTESSTSPLSQETQSPFRRFFTHGIFSNLRKKTSFKKSKDEEQVKEKSVEEDIKETEEKAEGANDSTEKVEVDAEKGPAEAEQIEKPTETEAETKDDTAEVPSADIEEHKDLKLEAEPASKTVAQTETAESPAAETADDAQPTEDAEPTNDKPDVSEEVITEAEILSSQEKAKPQGSPLKKLFTGAGLKKLSSKKQKSKKEAESKQAESGEQAVEQIQSPETQKPDSGASSPEESVEHVVGEVRQAEAAQAMEPEGEPVTSDSEKKKDGILPWSSFKKLVTPKKRVKRPSESEDEATTDKPKSSTLSSTESANAVTDEKTDEPKPSEEVPPEPEEETQAESNVEAKPEMTEPVPEEPKRKMDTSVSWEALICVGSSKKRARKTSDSDDEEPKNEEEVQQSGEEQAKITESPLVSSGEADHENLASSPEPEEELVSTWESFKRLVTHRKKTKSEDKSDEASAPEQTTSDSEIPKEESSFSLKKLIPRRKKKSGKQKQASSDVGSAEDDSDTPAVVPLSEYENDTSAEVAEMPEELKQEAAPVTQVKASTEDRSPSWISTTVENLEDEADVKQLSDIPEEADTAATPKSPDYTIAEDFVELTSEAVTCLEQVEETEMVSAVSRVTASPVTSGETTPVPGDSVETKTDVVLQEAVETITVTTCALTVTATEEQQKNAVVITEALPIESATKEEKTVLVAHKSTDATAICTGLDTKEIGVVKEESISKTSVESVTVVSQAVVTEISVEDTTEKLEKATAAKEEVYEAEVSEVNPDLKDALLENAVEEKVKFEEIKQTPEAETVTDLQEVAAVKLAVMTSVQQEPEVLEEPVVAEELPKVEAEGPVEPTVEESISAKTAEVTVVAIAKDEKMQVLDDVEESAANVEVAPIEEVSVAVSAEVMATLPDVPTAEIAKSQEDSIPVVAPAEDFAVIKETVCVISSTSETTETHTAVVGHEATMQKLPLVVPTGDHNIQVIVNDVDAVSAQEVVESNIEVASTKVTVVVEETCEAVVEDAEAMQANKVIEAEIIMKQSSVIVQEIIQNVVENFVETLEDETSVEKVESLETTPEKPNTSETITKDDDKQTRIVIEKPTQTINEAVEVAETVPVSLTGEIPVEKEEVAAVSVTDVQQETEVTKSEVELKQAEKKTDTVSEDGKGQVEATETSVEEKLSSTDTPAKVEITSEQCQVVKEVQIISTQEFNVGVVNTVNAVDEHVQDTNKTEDKSKGQESAEDMLHKDSEEPQTQDTKKQEESRDEDCQKSDAKNIVAKQEIAAEKTTNAIVVEEELENDIEPVSTEVATVS